MKMYIANILVWNGREFMMLPFQQAQTQENLGVVIREYVAAMGLRLVYWSKV
ncbi:hypothetical protein [Acaryochloris marina]|uniref:Uncharacterized protein n=1 Tax=Acaryochloris marina (strain MBIC 11017) TaxID=329726 RepID=A8ZPZ7_ACAM1|nr:hypothetical protein [Acaryochloris marina]ABW33168.1 hypothetical protein AM1_F0014 [Acaryochloris marina MBIC11017]BDM83223.1 hypothetical protein AM10699_60840 [Acaryochloris marina MBIC10699]